MISISRIFFCMVRSISAIPMSSHKKSQKKKLQKDRREKLANGTILLFDIKSKLPNSSALTGGCGPQNLQKNGL